MEKETEPMYTKKLAEVPSGDSVKKARGKQTRKAKQKTTKQKRDFTNISKTWILIEVKVQANICLPQYSHLQILKFGTAQHLLMHSTITHSKW